MIRTALLLTIMFYVLTVIESSVLWVFEGWVATIPLMTTAGILVMQRLGIAEGVAWFCILAILRGDVIAATIAFIGPWVTLRVFSTRSLYALFGIGLVSHAAGMVVLFVIATIMASVSQATWNISYATLWTQELLLIPSLYFGMNVVGWFEQNIRSRFALTSLS